MTERTKITVVGAGSAVFGLSTLVGILKHRDLQGVELFLHDVNADGLRKIHLLAEKLNQNSRSNVVIRSSTERKEAIEGAKFVVLSIAVDREKCWKLDREIALKYGINHYAENGGPGAFAHTARNLSAIMPILRDMEKYCPDAWLLNFTNPVPKICTAAVRYTNIKTIGICHQIQFGYFILAGLFAEELGLKIPRDFNFRWNDQSIALFRLMNKKARERFLIRAYGLNHFTFMLSVTEKETGKDLYPEIRERVPRLRKTHPFFEPLTMDFFEVFGVLPVPGDCHLCEYLPYTHNVHRKTWERYDIQMYDFEWATKNREKMWEEIEKTIKGELSLSRFADVETERGEFIIAGILKNRNTYEEAVNIPNCGHIPNLPKGAIVEVPAVLGSEGPVGLAGGKLPEPLAELCRRQVLINELVVRAIVEEDKKIALEALALDPMIDDLEVARKILDEYLMVFDPYLSFKLR
ncbi:MAG: family 4 glycosyl hydrolase [Candidatus Caldatribacteriaceae bacterium]